MTNQITSVVLEVVPKFQGYVYPNEAVPHPLWGFLIVLYPYITGLVAGGFIMASACSESRRSSRCTACRC